MAYNKWKLLCFLLAVFAVACGTLPRVSSTIRNAPSAPKTPEIQTSNGFLSEKHSKEIVKRLEHSVDPTDLLERFNNVIATVTDNPLTIGNRVILLDSGEASYVAMFKAIDNAKDHINLETFIIDDDAVGKKFSDALLRKQSEGVQVNLIYDGIGSMATPASFFKRLRDGGIKVLRFKAVDPSKSPSRRRFVQPDHRKILVVDGKIAFTGGVNISSVYSSNVFERHDQIGSGPWRDTDVQIEGPAVSEFQKMFLDTWAKQKGPKLEERDYYPKLEERGKTLVRVVGSTPGSDNRITFIAYVAAITFAKNTLYLTTPYFVPDPQLLKALIDAAKRGVDVKIIVPLNSDSGLSRNAARYHYADLMEAGVKIFERRKAFLHAKTAVVDGVFSTVGSTNLDYWSLQNDDEVNALILSREFASDLERSFNADLKESNQIDPKIWDKRKFSQRLAEWFAHLFAPLL